MHTCGKCGSHKPIDAFYKRPNGKPKPPCKECRRSYRPPHEAVTEKRCSMCGEIKGIEGFGVTKNTKSGRRSACRACERAWRPAQIVAPTEKRCPTCSTVKPAGAFYVDRRRPDGLYARCKPCHNGRAAPGQKAYRAANTERVQEWRKRGQTKFYSVPGRMAVQLERLREYQLAHPEWRTVTQQRRRARKAGAVNDFTRKQWDALKLAYGYRCAYCRELPKRLTIDHVIPLSKGGEHTARNIVPACWPCNKSKGSKPAPDHQISLPM